MKVGEIDDVECIGVCLVFSAMLGLVGVCLVLKVQQPAVRWVDADSVQKEDAAVIFGRHASLL